jgi:hypothetical protein
VHARRTLHAPAAAAVGGGGAAAYAAADDDDDDDDDVFLQVFFLQICYTTSDAAIMTLLYHMFLL